MNKPTADYIRQHAGDDIRQLALQGTKDPDVDLPFALDQIAGRQTARRKLPSWAAADGIVYPPHLSMEQCSSEQTARYKAAIARRIVGEGFKVKDSGFRIQGSGFTLVDLTGGFAVDFSFMAQAFQTAVYVERQASLCDIARQNFQTLGLTGTEIVCADATEYLQRMPHANLIYIDPARRDSHGQRTYGISDCTPDVVALRDQLLAKADCVVIKLSPMLDWRKAVSDIGEPLVSEVHIVSVGGECKELVVVMKQQPAGALIVYCVNDNSTFTYHPSALSHPPSSLFHHPSTISYLYEPNASVMKAGCFAELAEAFGVSQVGPNSHLFTAPHPVDNFPGRTFQVDAVTTLNRRELRTALAGLSQANITVRNFPLSVAELRRRLKLSEGGSTYIFATTLADKSHVLLVCRKTSTPK